MGPIADMAAEAVDVRFRGQSGRGVGHPGCPRL